MITSKQLVRLPFQFRSQIVNVQWASIALALLGFASVPALGAQKTWDGGAGSSDWNHPANWAPDGVPTSSDDVLLDGSVTEDNVAVDVGHSGSAGICRTITLGDSGPTTWTCTLRLVGTTGSSLQITGSVPAADELTIRSNGVIEVDTDSLQGSKIINYTTPDATVRFTNGSRLIWIEGQELEWAFPPSGSGATNFEPASRVTFRPYIGRSYQLGGYTFGHIDCTFTGPYFSSFSFLSDEGTTVAGSFSAGGLFTSFSSDSAALVFLGNVGVGAMEGLDLQANPVVFAGNTSITGRDWITLGTHAVVAPGATLHMGIPLMVHSSTTLTVNGSLTLDDPMNVMGTLLFGAEQITQNFGAQVTFWENSTLGVGHPDGLGTLGSGQFSGPVQIASSTTIHFRGTSPQHLGEGLPATVETLILDNQSGMVLDTACTVTEQLDFRQGRLDMAGGAALVGPAAPGAVLRSSGWINGPLTTAVDASTTGIWLFPVGTPDAASPADVRVQQPQVLSGTLTVSATVGDHPQVASSLLAVNRYWTISSAGLSALNAELGLTWAPGDLDGGADESDFLAARHNGSSWNLFGAAAVDTLSDKVLVPDAQPLTGSWIIGESGMVPSTPPDVDTLPSSLEFGPTDVTVPVTRQLVIWNRGNSDLNFTGAAVSLTGSDPGKFAIQPVFSTAVLKPNQRRALSITFSSGQPGNYEADLLLHTSDPSTPNLVVPLSGTAIKPRLDVTPLSYDFGDQPVGSLTPAVASFQLTNSGTTPVEFSTMKIELLDAEPGVFTWVSEPSLAPLAPNASRTVEVRFTPHDIEESTAALVIKANDATLPNPLLIPLTGNGVTGRASVSPGLLDFGQQPISSGPTSSQIVTVTNTGNIPLLFAGEGVRLTGPAAAEFLLQDPVSTAPIPAGASRDFTLAFDPATTGVLEAALEILTSDPDAPAVSVALKGVALGPGLATFGPYNGQGPGISTVGTGGHYATLRDATLAITNGPAMTGGGWTLLILSDLTESTDTRLTKNTNGHGIVIRPAPGVQATVTFLATGYNLRESYGHLEVGDFYTPTRNVVIDGCNTPGGTSRDLTLRNIYGGSKNTSMIAFLGDDDGSGIRNCVIENNYSGSGNLTKAAVMFYEFKSVSEYGPLRGATDDGFVENCQITAVRSPISQGIVNIANGTETITYGSLRMRFIDNEIVAGARGFWLPNTQTGEVRGNRVRISQPSSGYNAIGLLTSDLGRPIDDVRLKIVGNRFEQLHSPSTYDSIGACAILLDNGGADHEYFIANNFMIGLKLTQTSPFTAGFLFGIRYAKAQNATLEIVHNSIDVVGADAPVAGLSPSNCYGIGITSTGFTGTAMIQNNIIRMNQPAGACLYRAGTGGNWESDYNNLVVTTEAAYTGRWGSGNHQTLEEWQTATGQDLNSVSVDPYVPLTPDSGRWNSPSAHDGDLHFNAPPPAPLLAPALPSVKDDIDTEQRGIALATMGADEFASLDSDGDSVPNRVEGSDHSPYDGNEDGVPDHLQPHVVSLPNARDGRMVTLASAAGTTFSSVATYTSIPGHLPPAGYYFPAGLFSFTVRGASAGQPVDVQLLMPADFESTHFLKFGPLPAANSYSWYTFEYDGTTGLQTPGRKLSLRFLDGLRGDDDLAANTRFSLSGGPARLSPHVPPVIAPISDSALSPGNSYAGPTPVLSSGSLPVTWSLLQGPSGMTIESSTGIVTWPTATASDTPHPITIRATNGAGSDDESWTLNVPPPCTYALSEPGTFVSWNGGQGSVSLTTLGHCSWTAASQVPWITFQTGSGTGSGTVSFTVAPNDTTLSRAGTLTLAGETYTVTQAGLIPAVSHFAPHLKTAIQTTGLGWQEMIYNYNTLQLHVTPYQFTSGAVAYPVNRDEWIGLFHYDYALGRFTEAIYKVKL